MIHTIVTHPGSAHKDDLLACSMLMARHGAPLFRRVPTPEDLADVGTAVVDVGGQHAPERNNYDHHHFPREHVPTCSVSLVLESMGLYAEAREHWPWLEPAEWFDCRGPTRTADFLGVPRQAMAQLESPVSKALLTLFSRRTELREGDALYEVLRQLGAELLASLEHKREALAWVEEHATRWSIPKGSDTIEAIFLPRTQPPGDAFSDAVEDWIRHAGLRETVAALVYPDRRGSGYGLARYEDHPRLDFSRVGDEPDVHFAHVSGFMCKTSSTEPERLQELVALAWGSPPGAG